MRKSSLASDVAVAVSRGTKIALVRDDYWNHDDEYEILFADGKANRTNGKKIEEDSDDMITVKHIFETAEYLRKVVNELPDEALQNWSIEDIAESKLTCLYIESFFN